MAMTPDQIKAIEAEITSFGDKAIQYAASDPELSAHYNRLYRASKLFLAKSAKLALNAKHREISEKRKQAKEQAKNGGSPNPQRGNQRTSTSNQ
jgi:hypothetical protein